MKSFYILAIILIQCSASFGLAPITGTFSNCIGMTTHLADIDSATGGVWTSSNTAVATVLTSSGVVTGVAGGVATITYTLSGSYVTASFSGSATTPGAISGTTSLCVGTPSTLTDGVTGGVWSSSNVYVATISPSGVVTPWHGGSTIISYTTGCSATISVAVGYTDDSIYGATTLCVGTTTTLTGGTAGGTWASSNTAVATISTSGVMTGASAGTSTISYTVTGCGGPATFTEPVHVVAVTTAGTISGNPSSVAMGASCFPYRRYGRRLMDFTSNPSIATVNASSGLVTGISTGTATISYTVTGCGSTYYATAPMTVTSFNGISGHVVLTSSYVPANIKIWLITYNPVTLDLEALDSVTIPGTVDSVYYQFTGMSTDSFRIKAAPYDPSIADTIYVPTYHTSSFYWHDATVLYHVAGTGDVNQDISMATGTYAGGPGFIGGSVTAGANKGTSGTAPVSGLLMLAQNATTGAIVKQAYTDASGNYSISGIPYGNYFVYPELINYSSIPFTSITLSSSSHAMNVANFEEHTVSHTITPSAAQIPNIKNNTSAIIFPNPTNGKVTIDWYATESSVGEISVYDLAGRKLYNDLTPISKGYGSKQINLSAFTAGVYNIVLSATDINFSYQVLLAK